VVCGHLILELVDGELKGPEWRAGVVDEDLE
jgi:hypothetical protein